MNLHGVPNIDFQIMIEKTKKYLSYHTELEKRKMLQIWRNPIMIFVRGKCSNAYSIQFMKDIKDFYTNNFKEKKSDYDYNRDYLVKNSIWYPFTHSDSEYNMLLKRILHLQTCIYSKEDYPFLNKRTGSHEYTVGYGCYAKTIRNNIVFWNLFLLAIDEELYAQEIDDVLDMIYCLGFDETMIEDWCNAITYILSNKLLNETCDLRCKSIDGQEYFLHYFTQFD